MPSPQSPARAPADRTRASRGQPLGCRPQQGDGVGLRAKAQPQHNWGLEDQVPAAPALGSHAMGGREPTARSLRPVPGLGAGRCVIPGFTRGAGGGRRRQGLLQPCCKACMCCWGRHVRWGDVGLTRSLHPPQEVGWRRPHT